MPPRQRDAIRRDATAEALLSWTEYPGSRGSALSKTSTGDDLNQSGIPSVATLDRPRTAARPPQQEDGRCAARLPRVLTQEVNTATQGSGLVSCAT
jgi:hypothetical protein